jgi:hypothetical protein
MKANQFPHLAQIAKKKEKDLKIKVTHAVANGIRVTFSVDPAKGETAFARQLRNSLQKKES